MTHLIEHFWQSFNVPSSISFCLRLDAYVRNNNVFCFLFQEVHGILSFREASVMTETSQVRNKNFRWVVYVNIDEEEEQSLKLALRQPWVWSVSDFIFLASAYEGGWPVLSLAVSSSHQQCTVSVLIIAELARGAGGAEISNQISALAGIWTPPIDSPAR